MAMREPSITSKNFPPAETRATADQETVRRLFDRLSGRYDLFNCLSSLGLDAAWRERALAPLKPRMSILDVGTGTGDLALAALRRLGGTGRVAGLDFSEPMLAGARKKEARMRLPGTVRWVFKKAEEIPFEDERYDLVVSGFVLRNIAHHLEAILAGIRSAMKEGGWISFVDLTFPSNSVFRLGGTLYLKGVVGLWGRLLFGDAYPALYLKESMTRFYRAEEFLGLLEKAGFTDLEARPYLFGTVTHYLGRKRSK